jgi:LacI family transcriptional regulator
MRGLICASYDEEKVLRRLAASETTTILLDGDTNLPGIHTIRDDCAEGASDAIKYLAQLGHRRIAYADWQRADMNRWRGMGYRRGLRDAGLTRRRQWEIQTELTEAGVRRLINKFLGQSPRATALYCFNNTLASFAIEELGRHGVRVPEDVSVMGAGGEEIPGLTCHQADWHLMGRTSVQILLRALADPKRNEAEHHLSPHSLRIGKTTAAPG